MVSAYLNVPGQTFRDLQTLLYTFFVFPGACCKVIILFYWMEGWTFVGLKDYMISIFQQYKVQDIYLTFISVT